MAATLVQSKTASSGGATCDTVLDAAPKLNSILVAFVYANITDSTLITMSGWTLINGNGSSSNSIRAFWLKVNGATDLTTITAAATAATNMQVAVLEYSGLFSSPVDQSAAAATASATSHLSGTINTVEPTDLLLVGIGFAGSTSSQSFDSSFASVIVGANLRLVVGSRSVSVVGGYSTTCSWSTSRAARSVIVGLKIAGGKSLDTPIRPAMFKPGNAR